MKLILSLYRYLKYNNWFIVLGVLFWIFVILILLAGLLALKSSWIDSALKSKHVVGFGNRIYSSLFAIWGWIAESFEAVYNLKGKIAEEKYYWHYVVISTILILWIFKGSYFYFNWVGVEDITGDIQGIVYRCENRNSIETAVELFYDTYDEHPIVEKFVFIESAEFVGYTYSSSSNSGSLYKFFISTIEIFLVVLFYCLVPTFIIAFFRNPKS